MLSEQSQIKNKGLYLPSQLKNFPIRNSSERNLIGKLTMFSDMPEMQPIHIRLKYLLPVFIVFLTLFAKAQPPAGYYDAANGLSGATLKTALYNIVHSHTELTYAELWTAFYTTDRQANDKMWDMYSNCDFTYSTNQCGTYSLECDCYNREHSFPKSWFADATPMYTDLFHIYPTDGKVNGMRGNYPFGEVSSPTYTSGNGSKLGPCSYSGYTGIVFEPVDDYKGDFARSYFYMVTCYENVVATWYNNDANGDAVLQPNTYPVFETWFLNMLGEWSANDPVSQKETDRNNAAYAIQGNRNPFIDHPEYVYAIWGVGANVLPEPDAYPTSFSAHNIHLQWTDATGPVLPVGYLIRMSTVGFDDISAPTDGVTYSGNTDFYVPYGTGELWVKNLSAGTVCYFKIYSYSGNGASIDYKTDGNVPQVAQSAGN